MAIYLDHSATTPACPEAIAAMVRVLADDWGNPSSLHQWGERAAMILETARFQVAALVGAKPEELVFTSGGTEADNLALVGVARCYDQPRHLIISQVEHSAIAQPAEWLEAQGWAVTRLPVDRLGRVDPAALAAALRPETVLVSIVWGQSEVGTVQPIADLAAIARAAGVLFHTDAIQAVGRVAIDLAHLPIDLLSLSSHKLYGPQGVGGLYVRSGLNLAPVILGGGQESNLRAGTQALPAIAGFGAAAQRLAVDWSQEADRLAALRDRLVAQVVDRTGLLATGPINGGDRLAHHASFCLPARPGHHPSGRDLVRALDRLGIAASAGSACNSGKIEPNPALLAMGYEPATALAALRLTLGRSTTLEAIDQATEAIEKALETLQHLH